VASVTEQAGRDTPAGLADLQAPELLQHRDLRDGLQLIGLGHRSTLSLTEPGNN
jgi:hypothetical protein